MPLFEFQLRDPINITPWDTDEGPQLSWFALTDGWFRMPVGEQALFEYSESLQRHLKLEDCRPDYQIASFARDMLECAAPAVAPLPPRIERLAVDWERLKELEAASFDLNEADDPENLAYDAWRWLGERSPWTSYLNANPRLSFVRIGQEVRIHWDNRDQEIESVAAWTAQKGTHALPVDAFMKECQDFSNRLLTQMARRIDLLDTGELQAQIPLDFASLRRQHRDWETEFATHFKKREPDISWEKTEKALCALAQKTGLPF